MKKAIITVVGRDTVGIIAGISGYLADNRINILDISQTIVRDYFNMMMIADYEDAPQPFPEIAEALAKIGERLGVVVKCQREDIFAQMHRI